MSGYKINHLNAIKLYLFIAQSYRICLIMSNQDGASLCMDVQPCKHARWENESDGEGTGTAFAFSRKGESSCIKEIAADVPVLMFTRASSEYFKHNIEKTSHCLQETCVLLQSPWCNNNPFILQHGRSKAATHARHRVSRRRVVLAEKGQKGSNTSILISARNKCVALVVRTTCYYVA
jgi:hypothetical protein